MRYTINICREYKIEEEIHLNKSQPSKPTRGTCDYNQCLDGKLKVSTHNRDGIYLHQDELLVTGSKTHQPKLSLVIAIIKQSG